MDSIYMARALELASLGCGLVSPNPLVGSVIAREGRIVGEGFHQFALVDHAESLALRMAGPLARGATLYCNLEPCCHHGRTRPCSESLIEAGISRVVVAMSDPDPRVGGRGLDLLRAAGITVEVGLMAAESVRLNEIYLKFTVTGRPFVHLVSGDAGTAQISGEVNSLSGGLPAEWRPSEYLRQLARRYDALVLGDSSAANIAIAADYVGLARHRVPIIAGEAASVDPVRRAIDLRDGPDVYFIVLPNGSTPASSSRGLFIVELPGHQITSLIVLGSRIGLDASLVDADKVTFVVDSGAVKGSEWLSLPGHAGRRLSEQENRDANGFIEVSGYPVSL